MSLFDSINETNRAYCLHHVKRSMFLYKTMNYTLKNELYGFFYGSYGFLWILFTFLTGVVHSGLAGMPEPMFRESVAYPGGFSGCPETPPPGHDFFKLAVPRMLYNNKLSFFV